MLKKDIVEMCLLHLLGAEDRYGYDLLRLLHGTFPDAQESAVYALLRGLCRDGCSEQYLAESPDGPARKYYRLTPAGQQKLDALLGRWRALTASLRALGIE